MHRKQFVQITGLTSLGFLFRPLISLANPSFSTNVQFYTKKELAYEGFRKGFNQRINNFPDIIAVCKNTLGVQEAVLYATKFNMPIRVKSGGHCMEGLSSGNGGMQIVLKQVNTITWLSSYKIKVGPGCLLHQIYDELIPKNRILPGGSCATVGIGGLTLGGGYGLMGRLFGLTCDSLESVTMVDGKGNIVNSQSNPELLWACKGGGNGNFGIITEMVFKVHNSPINMSSYRFRSYNVDVTKGKEILKTWFEESKKLPNACFSTCLFNGDTVYILLTNVSKMTPIIQTFINKMRRVNEKYTSNVATPLAQALKNYYGQQEPLLFKNASSGLYKSFADIEPIIEDLLKVVFSTKGMIYQINTLGGAILNKDFEKLSSFPHRAYTYFSELQTYWEKPATGETQMKQFEAFQQIIANQGITAQYRNYPDLNFKKPIEAYYGSSLARLKNIKQKYDPQNLIQHQQSITM